MAWYRIICHCTVCGTTWKRRTKNPDSPDPACPNLDCGKMPVPIGMDLSLNTAPASIGANNRIKAVDMTAQIVMEDHGLTDLRSDQRMGDIAAPKLPPHQQARADAMFAQPPRGRRNPMPRLDAGMLSRFRDPKAPDVMKAIHDAKWRPPVHIINEPRQ